MNNRQKAKHFKKLFEMEINKIKIINKKFASYLLALAVMCGEEGTGNCDITITTSKGKINCHIEFSEAKGVVK